MRLSIKTTKEKYRCFAAARDVTAQSYSLIIRLVLLKQVETPVTISIEGKITDMNEATVKITGVARASPVLTFLIILLVKWREVYIRRYSRICC
jgi:hypothetical protein